MNKEGPLRTLLQGTLIFLIGTIIAKLLSYIYRAVIARSFTIEEYGIFSIALAFLTIVSIISNLGFSQGVERFLGYFSKENNKLKGIILSAIKITLPFSILISVIVVIFSKNISSLLFSTPTLKSMVIASAIGVPFYTLSDLNLSIFRGFKLIKYQVIIKDLTENLVKIILTIIAVYMGFNILGVIYSYVIALIISGIIGFQVVKRKVFSVFDKTIQEAKMHTALLSFSWPIMFTGLLFTATKWTDTLLLGLLDTKTSVGLYNAALPIAGLLTMVYTASGSLFIPVLSEMYRENETAVMTKVVYRLNKWVFLITLPAFILVLLFPQQLLTLLFGAKYSSAALALQILAIGYFFGVLMGQVGALMNITGKTKERMFVWLSGGIISIALNILLIPRYSLIGAAIASTLTFIYLNMASYYCIKKAINIRLNYKDYLKPVLAATPPLIISLVFLNFYTQIGIMLFAIISALFFVVYFTFVVLIKTFDIEDVKILTIIETKLGYKFNKLRAFMEKYSVKDKGV